MTVWHKPDPKVPWCPKCRAHTGNDQQTEIRTSASGVTEFSLSDTKKVTVQNCEECGRRMLIPWVHKQMLHYMTWGLCGLAVVLAAGALVDGRKGNLVAVYAAICTINPLSPPCIPPNPGFRDLSRQKQFPSSQ